MVSTYRLPSTFGSYLNITKLPSDLRENAVKKKLFLVICLSALCGCEIYFVYFYFTTLAISAIVISRDSGWVLPVFLQHAFAMLCPYISSVFAPVAIILRKYAQPNSPGVGTIIMGDIKSPLGIKRPRVKNSRSGVKVIMKSALRAPGDRYGVYLYYKRGRFVLCPYAPKLLHPDIHILKSVPTYLHRASGKR